jgi:regulator of protease activity HflC (stomatin/prohibitin superfamily)
MIRRVVTGDNERVLVIRKRRFSEILGPGVKWIYGSGVELDRRNVREFVYDGEWAAYLTGSAYFTVVETSADEVAVVSLDGRPARVIGPSARVLFWKGPVEVTFERIDARENPAVPARLLPALARLGREAGVTFAAVEEGRRGLVYLDGKLIREVGPGNYGFWNAVATPRVEAVEIRRQTLEVNGQEILTSDKVTVRVNISAVYEVADPAKAVASVRDLREQLYRALQVAVRQSLGKRTLEQALAEKTDIDQSVSAEVRREMEAYGVRVGAIALKDIILPGDIRELLNQVVAAEKQAQANLIRRREETAATRSLLNTAKLMEDNPLLVRLKELEALERVADKVEKITVVGGLNSLLTGALTSE